MPTIQLPQSEAEQDSAIPYLQGSEIILQFMHFAQHRLAPYAFALRKYFILAED